MAKVTVSKDLGGLEAALREFKKQVNRQGILQDCRKREFFMNKAEKRRYKQKNNGKKK